MHDQFGEAFEMFQYKAGYKLVDGGVHAQVLDFPAAITCGADLAEAQQLLTVALIDVAETLLELGQPLPQPNPLASDAEMDLEETIEYNPLTERIANAPRRTDGTDPHPAVHAAAYLPD